MRLRAVLVALCLGWGSLAHPPAPLRAQALGGSPVLSESREPRGAAAAADSPDWWREKKKRFHELAICAFASANVTYTLLVGFSGVGAVIGFTAALLGVVMCW